METTTTIYFYQSAIAENTKVDFNNPLHKELYDIAVTGILPSAHATKLMKKAGFEHSWSLSNTICWSDDLAVVERADDTNFIVKWHSKF